MNTGLTEPSAKGFLGPMCAAKGKLWNSAIFAKERPRKGSRRQTWNITSWNPGFGHGSGGPGRRRSGLEGNEQAARTCAAGRRTWGRHGQGESRLRPTGSSQGALFASTRSPKGHLVATPLPSVGALRLPGLKTCLLGLHVLNLSRSTCLKELSGQGQVRVLRVGSRSIWPPQGHLQESLVVFWTTRNATSRFCTVLFAEKDRVE